MEKEGKDSVFITQAKKKHLWVKDFYLGAPYGILLCTRRVASVTFLSTHFCGNGVHSVEHCYERMATTLWNEHIILGINPMLELEFDKNSEEIAKKCYMRVDCMILMKRAMMAIDHTLFEKVGKGYVAKAYAVAFPREVFILKDALESLIDDSKIRDPD